MYNPEKLGRIARTNNFEAMALMKDARKHTVLMRTPVYFLINNAESLTPSQIRKLCTEILKQADLANSAADDVIHCLLQNEGIFERDAKEKRGPYNTKEKENNG